MIREAYPPFCPHLTSWRGLQTEGKTMTSHLIHDECHSQSLSKKDFTRLSNFIRTRVGIKLPLSKLMMVETRIRKRLKELKIDSYPDYCDYLFTVEGMENELENFINVITTNKTDFFREPDHFEFLVREAVPDLLARNGFRAKKSLKLWSAACSRGNEAYTIAIVLRELAAKCPELIFDFNILGTDISTDVLETARRAVYQGVDITPFSSDLQKRYFLSSKDKSKNLVRVVPEIRKKVLFRYLNLMDYDFKLQDTMDIIFCRNVIIYFDKQTQHELIVKLCRHLGEDGYLFMGHSEVLDCHDLPLESVAPAVYKKVVRIRG
jgi:chemotaxis protein methyltransferase CheR